MVRIIVLKKKSLLWIVAALLCAIAVIAAVALYSRGDRKNVYPSAAMRTRIEEYELNVLAGKNVNSRFTVWIERIRRSRSRLMRRGRMIKQSLFLKRSISFR